MKIGPPERDYCEVALIEQNTVAFEGGWAFSLQSKDFKQSADFQHKLIGHGPAVVSSADGTLYETGSAHPPDFYIKNFQKHGHPEGRSRR